MKLRIKVKSLSLCSLSPFCRGWRESYMFGNDYLNGLQASFLRTGAEAEASSAQLQSELEAVDDEELERRCGKRGATASALIGSLDV